MYRLTVLYGQPENPAAFDEHYRRAHVPLAGKMRGLVKWTLTWVTPTASDPAPTYHLIADLYTASAEAMREILDSPEGQAARRDVANFATGGAVFVFGAEESVPL